jgi:hypothetical protein
MLTISGRAAAVAAEKMSFDLCDNALGEGVSLTMNDPNMLARFGHGQGVRGPETVESKLAEISNGTETASKTTNGTETAAEPTNGTETVPASNGTVPILETAKPAEVVVETANGTDAVPTVKNGIETATKTEIV